MLIKGIRLSISGKNVSIPGITLSKLTDGRQITPLIETRHGNLKKWGHTTKTQVNKKNVRKTTK